MNKAFSLMKKCPLSSWSVEYSTLRCCMSLHTNVNYIAYFNTGQVIDSKVRYVNCTRCPFFWSLTYCLFTLPNGTFKQFSSERKCVFFTNICIMIKYLVLEMCYLVEQYQLLLSKGKREREL